MKRMYRGWLAMALACLLLTVSVVAFAQEIIPVPLVMKGCEITLEEAQSHYESIKSFFAQNGYDVTTVDLIQDIKKEALNDLAKMKIMEDQIASTDLGAVSDADRAEQQKLAEEEYAAAIEKVKPQIATADMGEEAQKQAAIDYLNENNYTVEAIYAYSMEQLPYLRLYKHITDAITVTDEEARTIFDSLVTEDETAYKEDIASYEFYTKYYGQESYYTPAGYRGIKHILLATPEALQQELDAIDDQRYTVKSEIESIQVELDTAENPSETVGTTSAPTEDAKTTSVKQVDMEALQTQLAEKQKTLDDLNQQYEAVDIKVIPALQETLNEIQKKLDNGASFDEMIAAYGTDPGMENEPEKRDGYCVHEQSVIYDEAFQKTAMAMEKIGDISAPIRSSFGVHILQYVGDIAEGSVAFTPELCEMLRSSEEDKRKSEAYQRQMDQWFTEYEVTIHPEALVD